MVWLLIYSCSIVNLGAGSDFTAFLQNLGIPSCDLRYSYHVRAIGENNVYVGTVWSKFCPIVMEEAGGGHLAKLQKLLNSYEMS